MSKKTQITVANQSVRVVEYQGQRVVTFTMIDAVHQRPDGTAKRTFNDNRHRFIEGEDFFSLTRDAIRTESMSSAFPPRTPSGLIFTESGYLMLTKTFSDDLAWQVQRQLVRNYFRNEEIGSSRSIKDQAEIGLKILESAIKTLRLAPSAVLGSYQTLASHTGLPANLLPVYAVDAPDSAGTVSSEVTKSLTELLHEFDVNASARKVYPLLEQHGIVKHESRPSTKGEKQFWSVVDTEYGKNVTHPSNPKETQPAFYVSRFKALLGMIFPTGGANHA